MKRKQTKWERVIDTVKKTAEKLPGTFENDADDEDGGTDDDDDGGDDDDSDDEV